MSQVDSVNDDDSGSDSDTDTGLDNQSILGLYHESSNDIAVTDPEAPHRFTQRGGISIGRYAELTHAFLSEHINWQTLGHFLIDSLSNVRVLGSKHDFEIFTDHLTRLNGADAAINYFNSTYLGTKVDALTRDLAHWKKKFTYTKTNNDNNMRTATAALQREKSAHDKLQAAHKALTCVIHDINRNTPTEVLSAFNQSLAKNGINPGDDLHDMYASLLA
ncbi:hypothetical protein F5887DRAFT_919425 [Amanita rubescens]|nr:hypothetical protein F5887DRAFT_919425 [Amanita rubescens]